VGSPWTLAVEGDGVVIKHIMNGNLLVEVPGHHLEKIIVGIQARGAEFAMKIRNESIHAEARRASWLECLTDMLLVGREELVSVTLEALVGVP
jgi:hypothetical protein